MAMTLQPDAENSFTKDSPSPRLAPVTTASFFIRSGLPRRGRSGSRADLVRFENEEDEGQERGLLAAEDARRKEFVRRVRSRFRLAHGGYAVSRRRESVEHRVQWPVPEGQDSRLAVELVILRILPDGEVVLGWLGDHTDCRVVDRQDQAAARLDHPTQ